MLEKPTVGTASEVGSTKHKLNVIYLKYTIYSKIIAKTHKKTNEQ